jgi:hypothetical protein
MKYCGECYSEVDCASVLVKYFVRVDGVVVIGALHNRFGLEIRNYGRRDLSR